MLGTPCFIDDAVRGCPLVRDFMSRCFITAITRSHLADARALALSIKRYDDSPLYVLCLDDPSPYFDPDSEPFRVLRLEEVLPASNRSLVFYYTVFELCCAIRAYLHKWVLEHTSHGEWAFFDPDISVHGSLEPLFADLQGGATGLYTPHCLYPVPEKMVEPAETSLLQLGVYNGGFLALRRCEETRAFVDWFTTRLETFGLFKEKGLNCDQLWLNFLPQYFPSMKCSQHPGANVAYWNIHERALAGRPGDYRANGEPLLFMHFSQWRMERPHDIAWGRPVAEGTDPDALVSLGEAYKNDLMACGFAQCRAWPYGFSRFVNGRQITKKMRRAYYAECIDEKCRPGNPFEHPEWFPLHRYPPDVMQSLRKCLKGFIPPRQRALIVSKLWSSPTS